MSTIQIVDIKGSVFLDVAPCSLVEVYRRFRDACCIHHQGILVLRLSHISCVMVD
jgi:hypothetical protein